MSPDRDRNTSSHDRARGQAELAAAAARDRQFGSAMHECLAGLGIDTQVLGGGLTYTVPAGQEAAYTAALTDCRNRTGYGPEVRLSDDAYRVLYADYLDVSRCLSTNGYSPATPGDAKEFVATAGRSWNPYAGLSAAATSSAHSACPLPTY